MLHAYPFSGVIPNKVIAPKADLKLTDEQKEFIRYHVHEMNLRQMAAATGVDLTVVWRYLNSIGIRRERGVWK